VRGGGWLVGYPELMAVVAVGLLIRMIGRFSQRIGSVGDFFVDGSSLLALAIGNCVGVGGEISRG